MDGRLDSLASISHVRQEVYPTPRLPDYYLAPLFCQITTKCCRAKDQRR